jgi:predicted nucleic acid-binding protein
VIPTYVLDTGALIAAERGKESAARFFRLAHVGRARLVVPWPVIAEWWRGRTDLREVILGATSVVASIEAAKAAGCALARMRNVDGRMTVDAIVIATAALLDAVVVTGDVADFDRLAVHFPGVTLLTA